jgi:hypothetical protein
MRLVKVLNGIDVSRTPLPEYLIGLEIESLQDLSWTDPALGVQDCAWLPEQDASPALNQFEVYGDESFTLGDGVVIVIRAVLPMPQEQIDTLTAAQAAQIRAQRDSKLAVTDWVVIKAVETDTAVSADVATYRQALRDITAQSGFPWSVAWPTQTEM